jgi:hypothetical protein
MKNLETPFAVVTMGIYLLFILLAIGVTYGL